MGGNGKCGIRKIKEERKYTYENGNKGRECGTWERRTWGRKGMREEGGVGRKGMRGMKM